MDFSDLPEEVWDFLYPQAYWKLIAAQARLNHLDPYLVMGLIRQESAFSPRALSVANARGLMQVLPETAAHSTRPSRTRAAERRLYDPNYNVRVGCAYLAGLLKDFDGRPELAMAAYNAGDFRVKDWVKKYSFPDSGDVPGEHSHSGHADLRGTGAARCGNLPPALERLSALCRVLRAQLRRAATQRCPGTIGDAASAVAIRHAVRQDP